MEENPLLEKIVLQQKLLLGVEPIIFLYISIFYTSESLFANLILNKTCAKTNEIDGTCESELDSQVASSILSTGKSFTSVFISLFLTMFAGMQIDRHLKYLKLFIVYPIVILILSDFISIINVTVLNLSAFSTTAYVTILSGFSGSQILILMMSAVYVSHNSNKQERTVRMGYLLFAFTFGVAVGTLIGGYLVKYSGYRVGYIVCFAAGSITVVLASSVIDNLEGGSQETPKSRNIIETIVECLKFLRQYRDDNKRLMICLLVLAFVAVHSYPYGELTVMYLFLRNQFNWDSATYGTYTFLKQLTKCFGTIFCSEVLKRRLKLRDATIGIIGGIFELSYCLSWFFVQKNWQIYLASCLNMFEKVVHSLCLSLASKCVEPDEYGRLSSLFSVSNFIIPFTIIIYTVLYDLTITSFPRAIYLLSLVLCAPLILLFSVLLNLSHQLHKSQDIAAYSSQK